MTLSVGGPLLVGGLGPGPHGPPLNPALLRHLPKYQPLPKTRQNVETGNAGVGMWATPVLSAVKPSFVHTHSTCDVKIHLFPDAELSAVCFGGELFFSCLASWFSEPSVICTAQSLISKYAGRSCSCEDLEPSSAERGKCGTSWE